MALKQLLNNVDNFKYYPGPSSGNGKSYSRTGQFGQKSIPYGDNGPYVQVSKKDSFDLTREELQTNASLYNSQLSRGGTQVAKRIAEDEVRIGKFLSSTEGLIFIAKQNLLEKTFKPNLPNDIYPREVYSPLSTLTQLAGNPVGLHVNKSGLNPLYFNTEENSYFFKTRDKYNEEGTNRLAILYQSKIVNNGTGSVDLKIAEDFGVKFNDSNFIINTPLNNYKRISETNINFTNSDLLNSPYSTLSSDQLAEKERNPELTDFRKDVYDGGPDGTGGYKFKSFLAKGNYEVNNRQTTYGTPNHAITKNISDITAKSASPNSIDKINSTRIYSSTEVNSDIADSDLVPFYFQVVNNDDPSNYQFIHLRAYLDNFGDNFSSNWQSFKYSGRGENFYIYDSFTRGINIGFTVAIESRAEQEPQYTKINQLASLTAPDYARDSGFMRGNFVKLTVGDYLIQVPGFIQNLQYTVANNVPWDIARDNDGKLLEKTQAKILPMVITATMTFTPVHNFVPKKGAPFIGDYTYNDPTISIADNEVGQTNFAQQDNITQGANPLVFG